MSAEPTATLTNAKLEEIYQTLMAAEADVEARKRKNGYWSVRLMGRMPRTKKRRIRNKWIRSSRSVILVWNPPQP